MPEPMKDFNDMRRFSNAVRLQAEKEIEAITQQLIDGDLDVAVWEREMLNVIRDANLNQFITGKGGEEVSKADFLRFRTKTLTDELLRQRGHLRKFSAMIKKAAEDGKSLDFAMARAKLYARSTQAMFWQASVPVKLPQVPRDGKTRCRTNCKCRLKFEYVRDDTGQITAVLVYWLLSPAEHCEDCLELARTWNPKRIEVEDGEAVAEAAGMELDFLQAAHLLLTDQPDLPAREIFEMLALEGSHVCEVA